MEAPLFLRQGLGGGRLTGPASRDAHGASFFFSIWQRRKERPPDGRDLLREDYQPGTARKERKKPALWRMRNGDGRIPGWGPPGICIAADDHKQAGFQVSLWHFSTQQSACFRLWSSPSAQDSASGARSTFSKVTGMTIVRHVRRSTSDTRRKACAQGRRNNNSGNLGELIFRWMK